MTTDINKDTAFPGHKHIFVNITTQLAVGNRYAPLLIPVEAEDWMGVR